MNDSSPQLSLAQQIDKLCDRFESEWKAGRHPQIESYLDATPPSTYQSLLKALLAVEVELRRTAGQTASREELLRRFPQHGQVIDTVLRESTQSQSHAPTPPSPKLQAVDTTQAHRPSPSTPASNRPIPIPKSAPIPVQQAAWHKLGRFEILGILGQGGFGTVYRARDPQLKRDVALKVPKLDLLTSEADRDRFVREGRTAATLSHPHICPVFEAGVSEGQPFLVMALVEGKPLSKVIERQRTLEPRVAAATLRKVALALHEAHQKGIVHRDLKPGNIMIDHRGQPVVMDFGLSRQYDPNESSLTQTGAVMGTPAYMAPEQALAEHDQVGPATDVYALGVILYEMLTGQRPFHGDVPSVLAQVVNVEPKPPSALRAGLDPRLDAICRQALAKKSADRFHSMRELAESLGQYLKATDPAATGRPGDATASQEVAAMVAGLQSQLSEIKQGQKLVWWKWLAGSAALIAVLVATLLVALGERKQEVRLKFIEPYLADAALSYFLDGEPVSADVLSQPITLAVGDHLMEIKRQAFVIQQFKFHVGEGQAEIAQPDEAYPPLAPPESEKLAEEPKRLPPPNAALEALNPLDIPLHERFTWHPPELVAVLGEQRGTTWQAIQCLVLSPDDRILATGGNDMVVSLWDAQTLRLLGTLAGHTGTVWGLAFLSNTRLVSGSSDQTIRVWDISSRSQVGLWKGHQNVVRCLAASADGKYVLSGSKDKSVRLWDAATGQQLKQFNKHSAEVARVQFSQDGKRALSGGFDKTMHLFELATGDDVVNFEIDTPGGNEFEAAALSPDGTQVAAGANGNDKIMWRYWDTATGKQIAANAGYSQVKSQRFTPDGSRLITARGGFISGSGNLMTLSDARTHKMIRSFAFQAGFVWATAVSSDGRRLFTGTHNGHLRAWEVESGRELSRAEGPETVVDGILFPNGGDKRLSIGSRHEAYVTSLTFTSDGSALLSGSADRTIRLWNLADRNSPRAIKFQCADAGYSGPTRAMFTPGGKQLAVQGSDKLVLWDVATWKLARNIQQELKEDVHEYAATPDGQRAMCGLKNGLIWWNTATPEERHRLAGHPGVCSTVQFFPTGKLAVTAGNDKTVRLWDLESGDTNEIKKIGPLPNMTHCVVSPDAKLVAVACRDEKVRLYDADLNGERLLNAAKCISDHPIPAFSPDSQSLATGTQDGRLILWDTATAELKKEWRFPGPVQATAFDPSGQYLAAGGFDGTIYVLRIGNPHPTRAIIANWTPPASLPSPAGHWPFDDAQDHMIADRTGTAAAERVGGVRRLPGVVGKSLRLEGGEPMITIGRNPRYFVKRGLTMAGWIMPDADASSALVFESQHAHGLYWAKGEYRFQMTFAGRDAQNQPIRANVNVSGAGAAGRWSHVVGVCDENQVLLYIDGRLIKAQSYTPIDPTGGFRLGLVVGAGFKGLLDELQYYDVALTAEQVAALAGSYAPRAIGTK